MTDPEYALCDAATPGPWRVEGTGWAVGSEHANICALHDGRDQRYWEAQGRQTGQGPPNAAFIAHFSPSRVRALLEERDRLRDALEEIDRIATGDQGNALWDAERIVQVYRCARQVLGYERSEKE